MNKIQELVLTAKKEILDQKARIYPISFSSHTGPIIQVLFNLDYTIFISAGKDRKICIYNAINFTLIGVIDCLNALQKVLLTFDSKLIVSIPLMGKIEIFNLLNGNKEYDFGKEDDKNLNACFDYGNKRFLLLKTQLGVRGTTLYVYDFYKLLKSLEEWKESKNSLVLKKEFDEEIKCIDTSIMGEFIYLSSKTVVYKYTDKGELIESKKMQCQKINKINLTKKNEFLLVNTNTGVFMLNSDNLEIFNEIPTEWPILTSNISPLIYSKNFCKHHIAMAGGVDAHETTKKSKGGLELLVYDFLTNKRIMSLKGFFGPINHLEFFKDGAGILTAGQEGTLRIYRFDKKYFTSEEFK